MPDKSKAVIVPPTALIRLELGDFFDLLVGGKRREFVKWRLIDPQTKQPSLIGRMDYNRFEASKEPRQSYVTLEGETDDKKKAQATIHICIEWDRASPAIVDDWSVPHINQGTPWNTWQGRRAWLIMMDILHQLPDPFLAELKTLYIARVYGTFFGTETNMHWPFDRRAVLLHSREIGKLNWLDPQINSHDTHFAMVFFHELAHVILANRAFGSDDRFLPSLREFVTHWVTVPVSYITYPIQMVLAPFQAIHQYYTGAKPRRDFLSRYADATGWVINAIYRQNFFMSTGETQSPDILTGHRFFGSSPTVRLRNARLPKNPDKAALLKAGFPANDPEEATIDVHEDFAESLTYLAFFPDDQREALSPAFNRGRAKFFYDHNIWPPGKVIRVGGYLNQWAEQMQQRYPNFPLPDTTKWAVYFGPYAGKARGEDPYGNNPALPPPPVKGLSAKSSGGKRAGQRVEDTKPVDDDAGSSTILAEGEGQKSPLFEELPEIIAEKDAVLEYYEHSQKYEAEVGPVVEQVRQLLSEMERAPRNASPIELLRTAELHGEGVTHYPPRQKSEITGRKPGDLCLDKDGNLWIVVDVDGEGRITKITGTIAEPDDLKKFDVTWLRYIWRPDKAARKWKVATGSTNYRGDISGAMTYLIQLWGEIVSPMGRDLSKPASLLAEALEQAGIFISELKKKGWWNRWSLEDVENFCNRYGDGTQRFRKGQSVALGDVLRLKGPERIGVVTRVGEEGEPLSLLVSGGDDAGEVGEEVDAAKMLYSPDPKKIVWLWHPNGKAKQTT